MTYLFNKEVDNAIYDRACEAVAKTRYGNSTCELASEKSNDVLKHNNITVSDSAVLRNGKKIATIRWQDNKLSIIKESR